MRREFSAGGLVVRRLRGRWMLAAIRPGGRPEGIWALPKGLIGRGEEPQEAARREVEEETGVRARLVRKLGDVRYVCSRLGDLPPAVAHEVAETRWLPLEEAPALLAYAGEREMAERALAAVREGI